jgi:hypothetical protein
MAQMIRAPGPRKHEALNSNSSTTEKRMGKEGRREDPFPTKVLEYLANLREFKNYIIGLVEWLKTVEKPCLPSKGEGEFKRLY